jgi:tRNA threonylcarbamoyladenosine modification (KEOPS) complex  Pcc1 subunit
MKIKGRFEIFFPDNAAANAAAKSMHHEGNMNNARSHMAVRAEGNRVLIEAEAADIVAFRAAINAYMRNLQVFECVEDNHIRGAEE